MSVYSKIIRRAAPQSSSVNARLNGVGRATLICLVAWGLASAPAAAQQATPPGGCEETADGAAHPIDCSVLAAVDMAAHGAVVAGETPGLAVAVVRNGRVVLNRGYGHANLEWRAPVDDNTVFSIFSVTKTFTAAAILQMAERGQLAIDDKLSNYLPTFPRADEVTIRQLLSHTAGIRDFADASPALEKLGATPAELIKFIASQAKVYDFEPGTKFSYSNSNYVLLGAILEEVSNKSYREHMAASIFEPAGLEDTAADRNSDVVRNRASGYIRDRERPGRFLNGPFLDISIPYAAGNMRSTAADLARWFAALFDGKVISRASLSEMTTPARVKDGRLSGDVIAGAEDKPGARGYYGLGIRSYRLDGHRVQGPGGSYSSFSAKVANYVDDGFMLVVLANTGGKAAAIEERLAKLIFSRSAGAKRR